MKDVVIRYTIFQKENKEGLYLIDFDRNTYIAYAENIDIIKDIDEPIADSEELEKLGVYLLRNIREALDFSEKKTKKIIKYLNDENTIKSKNFKIFILLLEAYIIYYQIFLSSEVKNPILIDFFENEYAPNKNKIKIEVMKKLFNYLVGIKMLETKLEISKYENVLNDLFIMIDKNKNIFDREITDPLTIINIYNEIDKILNNVKNEDIKYDTTPE